MASRIVKSPAVQTKRQFAAQAAVAKSERELVKAEPLKVSTLKSGLTVASIENHSPVTTLGVVVKAGSRNETYDNAGVSHALRIAAGLGTKNNSAFGICRNLQQAGASMVCTQGREHTLYTVQATRDQTDVAIEYLADCMAALLLQRVLGMGASVKYGTGQGKLAQAALAAGGNAAVSAICQTYSDAGLLGAMVVTEAASAGKVVGAVAAALRSAAVTDEEVAAAKKIMLADIYTLLEDPLQQVENMGAQVLMSGDVMPAE